MSSSLPPGEELVPCPYNAAHMVVRRRMPKHLSKCRLTTDTSGFKTCKFNCSHIFREAEIASHESTCPDRIYVELAMVANMKPQSSDTKPVISTMSTTSALHDEDNWDLLPAVPRYNPMSRCLSSNVILNQKGGLPSERDARRKKESERLTKIRQVIEDNQETKLD